MLMVVFDVVVNEDFDENEDVELMYSDEESMKIPDYVHHVPNLFEDIDNETIYIWRQSE